MGVEIFLSLGLQLGLFYKNWGRNIFELGLQLGLFYKNYIYFIKIGVEIFLSLGLQFGLFYKNYIYFIKIGVEIFLNWGSNWRARNREI